VLVPVGTRAQPISPRAVSKAHPVRLRSSWPGDERCRPSSVSGLVQRLSQYWRERPPGSRTSPRRGPGIQSRSILSGNCFLLLRASAQSSNVEKTAARTAMARDQRCGAKALLALVHLITVLPDDLERALRTYREKVEAVLVRPTFTFDGQSSGYCGTGGEMRGSNGYILTV